MDAAELADSQRLARRCGAEKTGTVNKAEVAKGAREVMLYLNRQVDVGLEPSEQHMIAHFCDKLSRSLAFEPSHNPDVFACVVIEDHGRYIGGDILPLSVVILELAFNLNYTYKNVIGKGSVFRVRPSEWTLHVPYKMTGVMGVAEALRPLPRGVVPLEETYLGRIVHAEILDLLTSRSARPVTMCLEPHESHATIEHSIVDYARNRIRDITHWIDKQGRIRVYSQYEVLRGTEADYDIRRDWWIMGDEFAALRTPRTHPENLRLVLSGARQAPDLGQL